MPIIKSAKKRMRQSNVARARNLIVKKQVRNESKKLLGMIDEKKPKKALNEQLSKVQSSLDTASKKRVIHPNKAARKKARYNQLVKDSSTKAKPSAKKSAAKSPTKKAATKTASKKTKTT